MQKENAFLLEGNAFLLEGNAFLLEGKSTEGEGKQIRSEVGFSLLFAGGEGEVKLTTPLNEAKQHENKGFWHFLGSGGGGPRARAPSGA